MNPNTYFDFAAASLDGRITFARSTSASNPATYVGSNGLITSATNNQPRFDYDPVTLVCRGLLIEQSRGNALLYSEQFNQTSVWTPTRLSVSANFAVLLSPDGTQTADKLIASTDPSTSHSIAYNAIGATGDRTFSVFLKAGEYNYAVLFEQNIGKGRYFNLGNGTLGTTFGGAGAPNISTIEHYGNGWYRCSITVTVAGTWTGRIYVATADGGASFTGNGSDGIYAWGAQMEIGASLTSYIPTTTTSLTRNADVATITGANFSGFWRSGPGSILVRALPSTVSGTRPLVQVDDATADNIIALRGNATNPELYIRAGGADQATIDAGTISAAAYRLAGAWQAGSAAASLNSGLAVNGAPASIPAPTQMRLGSDGTNYLNGHLQAVQYWPLRLSNASLQNASSTAGYQSIIHPVSRDTIITEPV